jgi:hypothetical protein
VVLQKLPAGQGFVAEHALPARLTITSSGAREHVSPPSAEDAALLDPNRSCHAPHPATNDTSNNVQTACTR